MNTLLEGASHEATVLTRALLIRCDFDPKADRYDLACSGGADSTALALLGVATGKAVTLHHVDHGLRAQSREDAQLVEQLAADLGCLAKVYELKLEQGPNLEARAREARFGVLPSGVITAHHMDDQAETLLLNLLRGSGNRGLGAMRPGPTKPLLSLRKEELVQLCKAFGLTPAHDESNDDLRLRRNAVRHRLIPLLSEIAERDIVPLVNRVARHARSDDDALEELSRQLIDDPYSVEALRAVPEALRRRALRALVREAHPDIMAPSEAEIERIEAVVVGAAVAAQIEGGLEIRRSKGILSLKVISGNYASDDVT